MGRNPGKAKKRVKPNTKIRHPQDRAKNYLLTAPTPRTASSNDCRRHKFHLATLSSLLSKVEICMYPNLTFISRANSFLCRRKVLLSELHVEANRSGVRTSRYNIYNISTFISAEREKKNFFAGRFSFSKACTGDDSKENFPADTRSMLTA